MRKKFKIVFISLCLIVSCLSFTSISVKSSADTKTDTSKVSSSDDVTKTDTSKVSSSDDVTKTDAELTKTDELSMSTKKVKKEAKSGVKPDVGATNTLKVVSGDQFDTSTFLNTNTPRGKITKLIKLKEYGLRAKNYHLKRS